MLLKSIKWKMRIAMILFISFMFVINMGSVIGTPSYSTELTNETIAADDYYVYTTNYLLLGDSYEIYFQTENSSCVVDFFIFTASQYSTYQSMGSASYEDVEYSKHTALVNWETAGQGTHYFVFENDALYSFEIDIGITAQTEVTPEYESYNYDYDGYFSVNAQSVNPGDYYYKQVYLSEGTTLYGSVESFFSTDRFDFYILDSEDYTLFQSDENIFPDVSATSTTSALMGGSSSSYQVSETGYYNIIVSAKDSEDAVSFSMWYGYNVGGGFGGDWLYYVIIGVVVVAAVGGAAFVMSKRKGRSSSFDSGSDDISIDDDLYHDDDDAPDTAIDKFRWDSSAFINEDD